MKMPIKIDLDKIGIRNIPDIQGRKEFYRSLYNGGIIAALNECKSHGCEPQCSFDIADDRMHLNTNSILWKGTWDSTSLKLFGKYMEKNCFIYVHRIPTSLSDPDNLVDALLNIRCGAVKFPDYEFISLLNKDGEFSKGPQGIEKLVLVVDVDEVNKWPDGAYGIDKPTPWHKKEYGGEISGSEMIASNHPALIGFFGCEERVFKYLEKQKRVLKKEKTPWINIYNQEDSDIINEQPYARFLVLGENTLVANSHANGNAKIYGKDLRVF